MVVRLRSMGRFLERAPGNVMTGLRPPSTSTYMTGATEEPVLLGEHALAPHSNDPQPQQLPGGIFGGGNSSGYTGSGERGDAPPDSLFYGEDVNAYDSGTDSDTVSSCGDTPYDFTDIAHLTEEQQAQELFWAQ